MLGKLRLNIKSPSGEDDAKFIWSESKAGENIQIIDTVKVIVCDIDELHEDEDILTALNNIDFKSYESVLSLCCLYNKKIIKLRKKWISNSVQPSFFGRQATNSHLKHIIQQCYNRAVENPELLNQYQPFSPEVYGETSFELVTHMLNALEPTRDDIFIDMGSGVGQVVLQVAASTMVKMCIGIEKADTPTRYASTIDREFKKWMAFYGKPYQPYKLEKGDFLEEQNRETIESASLIFVNNFAFGPQVDHQLKLRFRELRDGVRIVSSKAFCALNYRITDRNLGDIGSIIHVSTLSPLQGAVSWTPKPFTYFLHRIDRSLLEIYFARLKNPNLKDIPPEVRRDRQGRIIDQRNMMRSDSIANEEDTTCDSSIQSPNCIPLSNTSNSSLSNVHQSHHRSRINGTFTPPVVHKGVTTNNTNRGRQTRSLSSNRESRSNRRVHKAKWCSSKPINNNYLSTTIPGPTGGKLRPSSLHHTSALDGQQRGLTSDAIDGYRNSPKTRLQKWQQQQAEVISNLSKISPDNVTDTVTPMEDSSSSPISETDMDIHGRQSSSEKEKPTSAVTQRKVPDCLLQYLDYVKEAFLDHFESMAQPSYKSRLSEKLDLEQQRKLRLEKEIHNLDTENTRLLNEGLSLLNSLYQKNDCNLVNQEESDHQSNHLSHHNLPIEQEIRGVLADISTNLCTQSSSFLDSSDQNCLQNSYLGSSNTEYQPRKTDSKDQQLSDVLVSQRTPLDGHKTGYPNQPFSGIPWERQLALKELLHLSLDEDMMSTCQPQLSSENYQFTFSPTFSIKPKTRRATSASPPRKILRREKSCYRYQKKNSHDRWSFLLRHDGGIHHHMRQSMVVMPVTLHNDRKCPSVGHSSTDRPNTSMHLSTPPTSSSTPQPGPLQSATGGASLASLPSSTLPPRKRNRTSESACYNPPSRVPSQFALPQPSNSVLPSASSSTPQLPPVLDRAPRTQVPVTQSNHNTGEAQQLASRRPSQSSTGQMSCSLQRHDSHNSGNEKSRRPHQSSLRLASAAQSGKKEFVRCWVEHTVQRSHLPATGEHSALIPPISGQGGDDPCRLGASRRRSSSQSSISGGLLPPTLSPEVGQHNRTGSGEKLETIPHRTSSVLLSPLPSARRDNMYTPSASPPTLGPVTPPGSPPDEEEVPQGPPTLERQPLPTTTAANASGLPGVGVEKQLQLMATYYKLTQVLTEHVKAENRGPAASVLHSSSPHNASPLSSTSHRARRRSRSRCPSRSKSSNGSVSNCLASSSASFSSISQPLRLASVVSKRSPNTTRTCRERGEDSHKRERRRSKKKRHHKPHHPPKNNENSVIRKRHFSRPPSISPGAHRKRRSRSVTSKNRKVKSRSRSLNRRPADKSHTVSRRRSSSTSDHSNHRSIKSMVIPKKNISNDRPSQPPQLFSAINAPRTSVKKPKISETSTDNKIRVTVSKMESCVSISVTNTKGTKKESTTVSKPNIMQSNSVSQHNTPAKKHIITSSSNASTTLINCNSTESKSLATSAGNDQVTFTTIHQPITHPTVKTPKQKESTKKTPVVPAVTNSMPSSLSNNNSSTKSVNVFDFQTSPLNNSKNTTKIPTSECVPLPNISEENKLVSNVVTVSHQSDPQIQYHNQRNNHLTYQEDALSFSPPMTGSFLAALAQSPLFYDSGTPPLLPSSSQPNNSTVNTISLNNTCNMTPATSNTIYNNIQPPPIQTPFSNSVLNIPVSTNLLPSTTYHQTIPGFYQNIPPPLNINTSVSRYNDSVDIHNQNGPIYPMYRNMTPIPRDLTFRPQPIQNHRNSQQSVQPAMLQPIPSQQPFHSYGHPFPARYGAPMIASTPLTPPAIVRPPNVGGHPNNSQFHHNFNLTSPPPQHRELPTQMHHSHGNTYPQQQYQVAGQASPVRQSHPGNVFPNQVLANNQLRHTQIPQQHPHANTRGNVRPSPNYHSPSSQQHTIPMSQHIGGLHSPLVTSSHHFLGSCTLPRPPVYNHSQGHSASTNQLHNASLTIPQHNQNQYQLVPNSFRPEIPNNIGSSYRPRLPITNPLSRSYPHSRGN